MEITPSPPPLPLKKKFSPDFYYYQAHSKISAKPNKLILRTCGGDI